MIKNRQIAAEISLLMQAHCQQLDASLIKVQQNCSEEEFNAYRYAVAHILAEALFQMVNPLYKEHPELKPEGWHNDLILQFAFKYFSR